MSKHPGFAAVQKSIAKKSGVSRESAGAILANASRHAGAAAKKANPRLKKVLGKMHSGGTIPQSGAYEMLEGEHVSAAPVKSGSQFNHNEKLSEKQESTLPTHQRFDGSDEPKPAPQGGDCHCISPDGIIKRDGHKRFAF